MPGKNRPSRKGGEAKSSNRYAVGAMRAVAFAVKVAGMSHLSVEQIALIQVNFLGELKSMHENKDFSQPYLERAISTAYKSVTGEEFPGLDERNES